MNEYQYQLHQLAMERAEKLIANFEVPKYKRTPPLSATLNNWPYLVLT